MNSVYLFDIDGTLLNVDKNFMKPLMKDILSSLSIDPAITDEETAYIKLERAGIDHLFSFGAFGCNYTDRNLLPAEAEKKFIGLSGKRIAKRNFIVIGDTPKDIECAKSFGATSVAVATGDYLISELLIYNPDLALESSQSPEIWVSELK